MVHSFSTAPLAKGSLKGRDGQGWNNETGWGKGKEQSRGLENWLEIEKSEGGMWNASLLGQTLVRLLNFLLGPSMYFLVISTFNKELC